MAYVGYTAEIPLGYGGLDLRKDITSVPIERLILANNVIVEEGLLQKERGTTRLSAQEGAADSIVAATEYWPDSYTRRIVVATDGGKLYKMNDGTAFDVTLKTGLTNTQKPIFCEGGKETAGAAKHLFFFNGKDPVQVLDDDGITTGDLATPPTDWTGVNQPTKGIIHRGRLWAIKNHFLYGSTLSDHEDFTGSGN
ncbi:MAG TPA: hypothetical protein ACFYEK_10905, partial [Candidatus Wunengus sp. YC60]|uniref:hypothetical protein n=1 Tax=Candidatus Wunengus sp. YC60 TaxID=3367697 RepID=UPI004025F5F3